MIARCSLYCDHLHLATETMRLPEGSRMVPGSSFVWVFPLGADASIHSARFRVSVEFISDDGYTG